MQNDHVRKNTVISLLEAKAEIGGYSDIAVAVAKTYCNAAQMVRLLPAANVMPIPDAGVGELSDGYHTFNELYHHRAVLFGVICNANPEKAWKSKLHHTGDMYDGMFIVGIETPDGPVTYHYDINPYWDMFRVKELKYAPEWDGHTPKEAIDRIRSLPSTAARPGEWISVEEDLPKVGQEIFVHARNPDEGYEEDYATVYDPSLYFPPWKYVTHWMPVPGLPKGGDMGGGRKDA